jgi:hypothetical protein
MKYFTKLLSLMATICIIASASLKVNASAYDTKYNELWINAGGSTFTTTTSTTNTTRTTCYMRLYYFKFTYYPENAMPGGRYIYSRLYTVPNDSSSSQPASSLASFSKTTSAGQYNYSYNSGCGGSGQSYKLKTNSSYTLSGAWATFYWSANPYI